MGSVDFQTFIFLLLLIFYIATTHPFFWANFSALLFYCNSVILYYLLPAQLNLVLAAPWGLTGQT